MVEGEGGLGAKGEGGQATTEVVLLLPLFMFFLFAMAKAMVPRYRYDQLMRLGWLFFFEIALVNIFIVAWILACIPS